MLPKIARPFLFPSARDRSLVILALGIIFSIALHFFVLSYAAAWSNFTVLSGALRINVSVPATVDVSLSTNMERIPMRSIQQGPASTSKARPDVSNTKGAPGTVDVSHGEGLGRSDLAGDLLTVVEHVNSLSQAPGSLSEIAPPTSDVAPPLPAAVMIQFSSDGFLGVSEQLVHRFKQAEAYYVLSVEGGKTLSFSDSAQTTALSEGAFVNGELMPARYFGSSGETVRFDWNTQQAVFSTSRVVTLQGEAKDPLSIMYQLMRLVRSGVTSVVVLDGRDELRYDLMLLGEEGLDTGGTHYSTWRVRLSLQSDPQSYREFWLGKEVSGMPLKIRELSSDGKVHELLAKRIEVEMP